MRERNEMILADLIAIRAEQQPDLDVLTFEHFSAGPTAGADEIRTYRQLHDNGNRIAAALASRGVARGDRFAVMMRNHPEFVETMIAASITASVYVPIDPRTRADKLAYMLAKSGCRGIVCADYCLDELSAAVALGASLEWILVVGDAVPPLNLPTQALAEVLTAPVSEVEVRAENYDTPLQIMFTSGTTGDPKGIVGSNFRFCAAGMLGALFGYSDDERPYTGLSLTHGNAQAVTLAPALTMSLRAVISRRFSKSRLWDVCRHYACTSFSLVGGMATAVYSEPEREDDADNPVTMVVSGGMPPAIWSAFEQRFDVRINEFYGAMDGGGMAYKPVGEGPVGSFGKPMAGLDMDILDEDGNICAPGVVGEICTRPSDGSGPELEYFDDDQAARTKIRGGWNHSGDMGHKDEHGWLYFDYRAGGGIRHNGDFINTSYVEKVIAEHPAVSDVFVYGVPAASGAPGEKDVVAAVVLADSDDAAGVAAVFAGCRDKLEANFVPSYIQVVDEIPKTASEKPQQRILLASFAAAASNVYVEST